MQTKRLERKLRLIADSDYFRFSATTLGSSGPIPGKPPRGRAPVGGPAGVEDYAWLLYDYF